MHFFKKIAASKAHTKTMYDNGPVDSWQLKYQPRHTDGVTCVKICCAAACGLLKWCRSKYTVHITSRSVVRCYSVEKKMSLNAFVFRKDQLLCAVVSASRQVSRKIRPCSFPSRPALTQKMKWMEFFPINWISYLEIFVVQVGLQSSGVNTFG